MEEPQIFLSHTVQVKGIDLEKEELYRLYFENRRSGGGEICHFRVDEKQQAIYITFETTAVAEAVCSKHHKVGGRELQVKLFTPGFSDEETLSDEPACDPYRLLFQNIGDSTSRDSLEMYIERVTGLEPEDIVYSDELDGVVVSFEDTPDFDRVQEMCQRRKLEGNSVIVSQVPAADCTSPSQSDARYGHDSHHGFGCQAFSGTTPPERGGYWGYVNDEDYDNTSSGMKKRDGFHDSGELRTTPYQQFDPGAESETFGSFDKQFTFGQRGGQAYATAWPDMQYPGYWPARETEDNSDGTNWHAINNSGSNNPYSGDPTCNRSTRCKARYQKPFSRQKTIKLGSHMISVITADCNKLRAFSTYLKQTVNGRFKWKRPHYVVITCTAETDPPADWDTRVTEAVEIFVQPIILALTQGPHKP